MPGKKWEIPTSKAYKKKMKLQENNGMRVQGEIKQNIMYRI